MNEPKPEFNDRPLTPDEMHAALFAQMIMHLASTTLVMLGRMPNPVTGKTETDLESAQLLIDQLEMLEVKTKGNLGAEEQHLLKQNLMTVRMAFVQTVNTAKPVVAEKTADAPAAVPKGDSSGEGDPEAKEKFTKSYGA